MDTGRHKPVEQNQKGKTSADNFAAVLGKSQLLLKIRELSLVNLNISNKHLDLLLQLQYSCRTPETHGCNTHVSFCPSFHVLNINACMTFY